MTVFLVGLAGFKRADNTQFAFDRSADRMRAGNHFFGNADVVFVRRRGFAVGFKRTVHHNGRIAVDDRRLADIYRRAVILVNTDRQFRKHFDTGGNHVTDHRVAGKFAGAGRSLQNDRGVDFLCRLQNGNHLFHVVDIKSRNAVAVFRRVIQNLTHCN